MRPSWARLALPLLVLAVVVAFLFAMLSSTGGRFVPQVVDLYVVCQYARAMAEGHPFRYNPGESPSTGSTSLLFTAWLGGAQAVGIRARPSWPSPSRPSPSFSRPRSSWPGGSAPS